MTWYHFSFLAENQKRLAENYQKTIRFLDENALEYIPSQAGPFLLLNIGSRFKKVHQRQMTFEDEDILRKKMISNGVYMVPGLAFHCPQPGYFRLTFALTWEELETGLLLVLKTLCLE
jgi:aspartate/methionine/tyrosine aminotransferase